MEPRRDPLTLDSFPSHLRRWREHTRGARAAQLGQLLELACTAHPDDDYGRSDLLVMAAGRADDLDVQPVAESLFRLACAFGEDKVLSARGYMLRWKLGQDAWAARELSESWRRDRSGSVADHERIAGIWLEQDEYNYAWGWCERGLMLAEELDLSGRAVRGLLHLRVDILACLDREPLEPLDPDCPCMSCAATGWAAA